MGKNKWTFLFLWWLVQLTLFYTSTGHSYVFHEVPFMSPAQFSTGVLSILDTNSLSCLQSLQISEIDLLLPLSGPKGLHLSSPRSLLPGSFHSVHPPGAAWVFSNTQIKMPPFCQRSPHTCLHLCWQSHFCCSEWHFLTVALGCQPLTSVSLCTPCSCLGTPLPTSFVHPALPLASRSRSFFWDAFPDLPGKVDHFCYHGHISTVDRTKTLTRSHGDSVRVCYSEGLPDLTKMGTSNINGWFGNTRLRRFRKLQIQTNKMRLWMKAVT